VSLCAEPVSVRAAGPPPRCSAPFAISPAMARRGDLSPACAWGPTSRANAAPLARHAFRMLLTFPLEPGQPVAAYQVQLGLPAAGGSASLSRCSLGPPFPRVPLFSSGPTLSRPLLGTLSSAFA
jgi:hypothetical protein